MHFFKIGINFINVQFIIGYEEDINDFYLKGKTVRNGPRISCRIFDSEGCFLFSMNRNRLSHKGEVKFPIESKEKKLAVFDDKGNPLLKIEIRDEDEKRITYIEGKFYDKRGRLAARGNERGLLVNCPLRTEKIQ